ncbi:putative carboxylesterase, 2-hydroxyisoflavanone dehydratase [Lupinus albus]|uniref:Putative carboxylesterase, 2-hydroxyisoflavanone dehydratase n=1 Tax=Lupinus albus TaxID=3870 RepID=A0A6A4QEJ0_LUPAL|nr:putative carboxylesterase, 2-hydroxyisoflavanone dehydratase [Lupinus albus]
MFLENCGITIILDLSRKLQHVLTLPKITNQTEKVPILVYFHGGAFFTGSAFCQLYHHHFNNFVSQVNVMVVSVEYRLAPENPLPACYDDCWDALKWVSSHYDKSITNKEPWLIEHGDFKKVFIGGDSAGGNIVHNIAMRAGTEALPCGVEILGAFLSHPFFCGSQPIGSEPLGHGHMAWNLVYPNAPGGVDNPFINPLAEGAPRLSGLGCSRILVCVAGKDQLRDRGILYYEAVKKSGWKGEVELFEEKEEDHVYHVIHPQSQNAYKFFKRLALFLLYSRRMKC